MQGAAAEGMSRASPSAMDKADESAKKARLEPPNGHVKQELGVHEAAAGGGAIVAAGEHSPRVGLAVRIDKRVLHCPLCTLPFKPPVRQCKGGHFACGVCVAQLPRCQCKACVDGGGLFGPCPALDAVVSLTRIEYPNAGCQRYVTYHEAGEHQSACAHAPCRCTEPGCELVDAAPLLAGHLEAVHFVQVRTVHYGRVSRVQVPVSAPRLLLLVEEDDGRVFIHPDRGRARRVHVRRVRGVRQAERSDPAAVHVQDVGKPCGVEPRQDGRRPGGDADEEQHLGGRRGRRQRADVPLGAGGVPGPRSGRGWHGGGPQRAHRQEFAVVGLMGNHEFRSARAQYS